MPRSRRNLQPRASDRSARRHAGPAPTRGPSRASAHADSGNLEIDLPELLVATAEAAKAADTSVAPFVDEVQYLSDEDLRGLIVALHRVAQEGLPMVLFGAGLPQVAALAGDAKSYAERLFAYPEVGALTPAAATSAVLEPIKDENCEIESAALEKIVEVTKGYRSSFKNGESTHGTRLCIPRSRPLMSMLPTGAPPRSSTRTLPRSL